MAKITPIVVNVTNGDDAAEYVNEAIKDVEVDDLTITGDGINTPLSYIGIQNIPISWLKVASVLDADPLAGNIGFNNTDLSQVTEIYLSNTSHQPMDVSQMLADSEGSGILIQQKDDDSKFIIFLTNSVTDNTPYHKFAVSEYDSGVIFDDGAELITTYTAKVSTGGGHVIQDKDNNNKTQESVLKYDGKVIEETGKTTIVPRFEDAEDVNVAAVQDGDTITYNSTTEQWEDTATAPDLSLLNNPEYLDVTKELSTSLEHGYKIDSILAYQETGANVTISLGSVGSGIDIVNAEVIPTATWVDLTVLKGFFHGYNDQALFATLTGANITLYFTFKALIS